MQASDLCCKLACPALGCNLPEAWILCVLFLATMIFCIFGVAKSNKQKNLILFYVSMLFWNGFMFTINIAPFHYTESAFELVYNVSAMLILFPHSFAVLILCELMFDISSPGIRKTQFFRIVFTVFLLAFLTIAIVLSAVNEGDPDEMRRSISLWRSSTDLVVVFVMSVPCTYLSRLQRKIRAVVIAFWIVFAIRIILNAMGGFGSNPISNYLEAQRAETTRILAIRPRIVVFSTKVLFDIVPAVIVVIIVGEAAKIAGKLIERNKHRRSDSGVLTD